MNPTTIEALATALFILAVLHTFSVKRFAHWAHKYPKGSIPENVLHFLAETEVVFGLWAAVLFVGVALIDRSVEKAVHYIESLNFTEPKFVLVVMVVAATRPVVALAEGILNTLAGVLPMRKGLAFYLTALALGPLLGSFITEPAAMTYLGSLVEGIGPDLKYALVAGAVTGGGLTVIANAPNPAGVGILQTAKAFENEGISPLGLFLGALLPTLVAIVCFWLL